MSPRIAADQRAHYLKTRREQIIDAAIDVFAKHGFARANIEQIASAAGVAKGTLYLYFDGKEEIFKAVLDERMHDARPEIMVAQGLPPEGMLHRIAQDYFAIMESQLPFVRMALADSAHFPAYAGVVYDEIALNGHRVLGDYLEKEEKAGEIRPLDDPRLTARLFVGMLLTHVLLQEVLDGKSISPITQEAWVRECIRIFKAGIESTGS